MVSCLNTPVCVIIVLGYCMFPPFGIYHFSHVFPFEDYSVMTDLTVVHHLCTTLDAPIRYILLQEGYSSKTVRLSNVVGED